VACTRRSEPLLPSRLRTCLATWRTCCCTSTARPRSRGCFVEPRATACRRSACWRILRATTKSSCSFRRPNETCLCGYRQCLPAPRRASTPHRKAARPARVGNANAWRKRSRATCPPVEPRARAAHLRDRGRNRHCRRHTSCSRQSKSRAMRAVSSPGHRHPRARPFRGHSPPLRRSPRSWRPCLGRLLGRSRLPRARPRCCSLALARRALHVPTSSRTATAGTRSRRASRRGDGSFPPSWLRRLALVGS